MSCKINYTNFNPETYLEEYIMFSANKFFKKCPDISDLTLNLTKVDDQGFVLNLDGFYNEIKLKSWWTGLSLYYCAEKIFEDFLSKTIIASKTKKPFDYQVYKSYPMDSFGYPQNT